MCTDITYTFALILMNRSITSKTIAFIYNCMLLNSSITVDNVRRVLPKVPQQQENGSGDDMGEGDYQAAQDWAPNRQGGSGGDNKK